jgi:hypothetical protein
MIKTTILAAALALSLAGCAALAGEGAPSAEPGNPGGIAGMCAQDQPDCVDTPMTGDPMPVDETGIRQFRRDAKFYLGKPKSEVPDLIRIARIDKEQFALTEDYQIGRITVELDDLGDGPIVTKSTVELPDGPESFTLDK